VTNIVLDHKRAARLALEHLKELGHEEIAFIKGQVLSSDSEDRWNAIGEVAAELGIRIRPELTVRIEISVPTPKWVSRDQGVAREEGTFHGALCIQRYFPRLGRSGRCAKRACVCRRMFSRRVRRYSRSGFANPGLTTVRQPLLRMGEIAAQTLVNQIEGREECVPEIAIEPEFVVRDSTASVRLEKQLVRVGRE